MLRIILAFVETVELENVSVLMKNLVCCGDGRNQHLIGLLSD